jgi:hypothetical protein
MYLWFESDPRSSRDELLDRPDEGQHVAGAGAF